MKLLRSMAILTSLLGSMSFAAQPSASSSQATAGVQSMAAGVKAQLDAATKAASASSAAPLAKNEKSGLADKKIVWEKLKVSKEDSDAATKQVDDDIRTDKTQAAHKDDCIKNLLLAQYRQKIVQRLSGLGLKAPTPAEYAHITADSLAKLESQRTAIHDATEKWLAANKDVVDAALGDQLLIDNVKEHHEKVWALLKSKNLPNMSVCNYIFRIPNSDAIVTIAGHCNRRTNMKALADDLTGRTFEWNKRTLTKEDVELFQKDRSDKTFQTEEIQVTAAHGQAPTPIRVPRTYQTLSRFASYLLFRQAQNQFKFVHVDTPQTHIVQIPGRQAYASDMNYVVIQKFEDNLEEVEQISAEEEREITTAIQSIGLFACNKGSLKRRKSDKKIIMLDFEQPDCANPREFFTPKWSSAGLWDYAKHFIIK